jgi:hypothetical protein
MPRSLRSGGESHCAPHAYFDTPYYVAPNEPVGQEAFAVIRERTCAGFLGSILPTIIRHEFIARSTRMPHFPARLSTSASSHHDLSECFIVFSDATPTPSRQPSSVQPRGRTGRDRSDDSAEFDLAVGGLQLHHGVWQLNRVWPIGRPDVECSSQLIGGLLHDQLGIEFTELRSKTRNWFK